VIRAAYWNLAAKYHPDNDETGDEAKFHAVQRALQAHTTHLLRARWSGYSWLQNQMPLERGTLLTLPEASRVMQSSIWWMTGWI
jgi:hypothetical protein